MYNKLVWVLLEKVGVTIINFVALIVMSRLLTPDDYGVYGTMILFIAITETLIDSGFGGALVQKKNIAHFDINTLFFFNILISLVSYVLLFVTAPFIEDFYSIHNLALYFRVLGITLILYAISILQVSLFNRNLDFKKSAIINLSSYLLAAIIAVAMAYYGYGVWALILQLLLSSLFLALFYWMLNPISIKFELSKESFNYLWKFGINTVGANILQTLVNNIATSIIPKIGSSSQSGLYFQANRVSNLPTSILTQCIDKGVFPILSKEASEVQIISKARSLNRIILSLIIPLFPILSLISYPVVMIILGKNWIGAVEYLSILSWSGIALTIQSLYRNIIKSTGKTQFIFIVEVFKSLLTILALFISMRYGVLFLVYTFTVSSYLGVIIWGIVLSRHFNYSFKQQIFDFIKPTAVILLIILVFSICNIKCNNYYSLILAPVLYLLYWMISVLLFKNEDLLNLTKQLIIKFS